MYPTVGFRNSYSSSLPGRLTAATVALIAGIALVFLLYDVITRGRLQKVSTYAQVSSLILDDVFPRSVKERLIQFNRHGRLRKRSMQSIDNEVKHLTGLALQRVESLQRRAPTDGDGEPPPGTPSRGAAWRCSGALRFASNRAAGGAQDHTQGYGQGQGHAQGRASHHGRGSVASVSSSAGGGADGRRSEAQHALPGDAATPSGRSAGGGAPGKQARSSSPLNFLALLAAKKTGSVPFRSASSGVAEALSHEQAAGIAAQAQAEHPKGIAGIGNSTPDMLRPGEAQRQAQAAQRTEARRASLPSSSAGAAAGHAVPRSPFAAANWGGGLLSNLRRGLQHAADPVSHRRLSAGHFVDKPIADRYSSCTVLFSDFVGFTAWSATVPPETVLSTLETYFSYFDALARRLGVFKVETIGDWCDKTARRAALLSGQSGCDARVIPRALNMC